MSADDKDFYQHETRFCRYIIVGLILLTAFELTLGVVFHLNAATVLLMVSPLVVILRQIGITYRHLITCRSLIA